MNTETVKAGHTLTLGYLCLADVGPLDIVLAAGRAGFQSVGVRLTARRPDESWSFESVNDRAARRVLARALADHGLSLSNVSSFHLYPEVTLEHLRPVIEASAELGASTLIACIYRDPDSALTDFLGEYAAEAEAAGLRIAIETVSYSACRTLSGARELLRQVGSPALGLMLDPGRCAVTLVPVIFLSSVFCEPCRHQPRSNSKCPPFKIVICRLLNVPP